MFAFMSFACCHVGLHFWDSSNKKEESFRFEYWEDYKVFTDYIRALYKHILIHNTVFDDNAGTTKVSELETFISMESGSYLPSTRHKNFDRIPLNIIGIFKQCVRKVRSWFHRDKKGSCPYILVVFVIVYVKI